MFTYKVRDLINLSRDEIWSLPDQDIEIAFEDGSSCTASARSTIFSWYGWVFFKLDPTFQVTQDYHYGNVMMTKNNELDFLGRCMTAVAQHIRQTTGLSIVLMEDLWKLVYYLQNQIYNDMSTKLEAYVTTVSALDILEIVDHPEIKAANAAVRPTEESLTRCYATIKEVLYRPDDLVTNWIARQVRQGGTDIKQANQVVGPVGYRTEIDSGIFPNPILPSFSQGLKTLHDLGIESRSATKALMFTKSPLADTQYYNREMQLMACAVMNIHHGCDCGSKHTIPFHVNKGSLSVLDGKYHVLENGKLELITPRSTHLQGKIINMRSVLGCQHPDPSGVCGTCFGELQWSIASGTNIGHACVVEICEKISQLVLSVKHVDSSSSAEQVVIDAAAMNYIERGVHPNEIRLRSHIKGKNPRLRFARQQALGLAMLGRAKWELLNVWDISGMDDVYVVLDSRLGPRMEPVSVSMGSRLGSFTLDFLKYINTKGVDHADCGDLYEVDLSDWDFSKEVWQLPLRHRNMIEFKMEVEEFIKCGGKNAKKGQSSYQDRLGVPLTREHIGEVLKDFHELISSKLFINIAHLEITLYATMVRNREGRDFRLPKGGSDAFFATYNELIANRSLAPAMAYESQRRHFVSMDSFSGEGRPESPLDPILRGEWELDRSLPGFVDYAEQVVIQHNKASGGLKGVEIQPAQ